MEIFITLTKYNTRQWLEEGNLLPVVNYLIGVFPASYNSFYEDWDIPINVHGYGI